MAIFDSLIKPALDTVNNLISQFHLSPEDKAKADQALAQLAQDRKKEADDYEVQLNQIASQNIQADANSQDKFTQRARPFFMYIIEAILAFNYIGVPIAQMFKLPVAPIVLPADLLTLFGICVTGYVFARSAEKIAALPGASTISALGVKISNTNAQ
jgi:hypothetical protein